MVSFDIRQKFLEFFKHKGHTVIPSSSLLPDNDPTVLFTTAGMQPLVPFLLGQKHPAGTRLVNFQKCVRTGDLDEVGDNTHLSFFEMLGNWSLGDFFKKEAITWSFEFLTSPQYLHIPVEKLAVTVFAGDEHAPRDEESFMIWKSLGIPEHRISFLGKKDNWWGPAGKTGPCGPDTEMFYYVGKGDVPEGSNVETDPQNWMEIWNDVFMEYIKTEEGLYQKATQQNVDTGMGLERITAVLSGVTSPYDTDIFASIIDSIERVFSVQYQKNVSLSLEDFHNPEVQTSKHIRIIADHVRTSVLLLSDGVIPSNTDQGYVLRRLIRRAIRSGGMLGGGDALFLSTIAQAVIDFFGVIYPQVAEKQSFILQELVREEEKFKKTLHQGIKEFERLIQGFDIAFQKTGIRPTTIPGAKAFKLYDTYGFPLEMTRELAQEKGITVDEKGFYECLDTHQQTSRAGAEKKFASGLADHSEMSTKYHTATHLMHKALKMVLGDHVEQKGSNITPERMRFDFSHFEKMTEEQKQEVERIVNEQITQSLPVSYEEMSKESALTKGAIGLFGDKYGDRVKVYTIGSFSCEFCDGPHVENTSVLGRFSIVKEEAIASGIRRIRAVLQ